MKPKELSKYQTENESALKRMHEFRQPFAATVLNLFENKSSTFSLQNKLFFYPVKQYYRVSDVIEKLIPMLSEKKVKNFQFFFFKFCFNFLLFNLTQKNLESQSNTWGIHL